MMQKPREPAFIDQRGANKIGLTAVWFKNFSAADRGNK